MMEKSYFGWREPEGGTSVKIVEGKRHTALPLYLELWSHSPAGFEWGYAGSGPAQLALALLANATDRTALALDFHPGFKADVVMHLAKSRWVLTASQIVEWVLKECERKLGLVDAFSLPGEDRNA